MKDQETFDREQNADMDAAELLSREEVCKAWDLNPTLEYLDDLAEIFNTTKMAVFYCIFGVELIPRPAEINEYNEEIKDPSAWINFNDEKPPYFELVDIHIVNKSFMEATFWQAALINGAEYKHPFEDVFVSECFDEIMLTKTSNFCKEKERVIYWRHLNVRGSKFFIRFYDAVDGPVYKLEEVKEK